MERSYINAHCSRSIMWIDMMYVPKEKRRQGIGSALYEDWEKKLPSDITLVRLMAADAGDGPSDAFWESMGFDYQYDGDNLDYESKQMMWKGVNGHSTPDTVLVDEDDDE